MRKKLKTKIIDLKKYEGGMTEKKGSGEGVRRSEEMAVVA